MKQNKTKQKETNEIGTAGINVGKIEIRQVERESYNSMYACL